MGFQVWLFKFFKGIAKSEDSACLAKRLFWLRPAALGFMRLFAAIVSFFRLPLNFSSRAAFHFM